MKIQNLNAFNKSLNIKVLPLKQQQQVNGGVETNQEVSIIPQNEGIGVATVEDIY